MRIRRLALLLMWGTGAALALMAPLHGASKNFIPDVTFTGSSLTGWKPLGRAEWRAENGEIVATPKGASGWLVLEKSYQDVALFSSFRCATACTVGALLRAEKTPSGGMKGILVSLSNDDMRSYRIVLDAQGNEISRERLRSPGGGQLRVAPPPPPETAEGGRGRGQGANAPAAIPGLPSMPAGIPSPIQRTAPGVWADKWNTLEVVLDANIVRTFLNDNTGVGDGVAEESYGRYGPIALYASSTGEVRFKDLGYKDLQPRVALPEKVSSKFRMQTLNEFYYSWAPAVADFNHDNQPDIVAGPFYYLGPDYNSAKQIYIGGTIDPGTQYFNGLQFAYDFTGDGWPDVLNSVFQRPAELFVNPRGESRRWDQFTVTDRMTCELMLLKDIDGDGKLDFIFKDSDNKFVYANPDPANPTGLWVKHPISVSGPWANHGMGVGDINSDGRADFVNAYGWWEQPAKSASPASWTYHPESFGVWNRSSPGGSEIAVYDVNGDGLNDLVTSLQAHGWGLSWFEQKRGADRRITFVEHPIMGDFSTKNAGDVVFSEPHGGTFADVDGDGVPDYITGKRFWSHLDTYIDPDPHGPPVLYVYRTVRNTKAPGGAEFVPELIHNRSGVGSGLAVADLNKDGAPELITSTKRGTFIFWNNWKK